MTDGCVHCFLNMAAADKVAARSALKKKKKRKQKKIKAVPQLAFVE